MDDKQREAMEVALTQALEERKQLDQVISYLSQKLGHRTDAATPAANGGAKQTATLAPGADPMTVVSESEFFGLSSTKASKQLLERVGRSRPLRTEEILAAITKGGVKLGGNNPQGTLYKSLDRDKDTFHKVGKGRWGLKVWYPASKTVKPKVEFDEESLDEATDA